MTRAPTRPTPLTPLETLLFAARLFEFGIIDQTSLVLARQEAEVRALRERHQVELTARRMAP